MNFHLTKLLITIRTKFQKLPSSTILDNSPMSTQNNVTPAADPLCGGEIASNDMLQHRRIKKDFSYSFANWHILRKILHAQ